MIKRLWIDDMRKAEHYLDNVDGVVSESDARLARKLVIENEDTVEIIYLDNFLGHPSITGEHIMGRINYRLDKFKNLKKIYLHSSDDKVVARTLERHKESFKAHGIDVIDAPYRDHD
jgi:hypothetical protein